MSSAKREGRRSTRRVFKSDQPPALRRGRENWVVRWIGAAKRRSKRQIEASIAETLGCRIIRLSSADTFGRPIQADLAGQIAQVLLFDLQRKAEVC